MKVTGTTRSAPPRRHSRPGSQRSSFNRRSLAVAVLAWLFFFGGPGPVSAQAPSANEYAVKAAFLFHFAQFVEWPNEAFSKADSPLVYCTIGEDPFYGELDASLKGKTISGHPLQIRHVKQAEETQNCHVVFVGEEEKKRIPATLAVLQRSPVLTVGESEQFAQNGGMIGFRTEENKIRFEINLESAERAKLRISSRLLALAKTVIGRPRRD